MSNPTYISVASRHCLGTWCIGGEHYVTIKRYADGQRYAYFYHGVYPNLEYIDHVAVSCVKEAIDALEALVNGSEAV